MIDYLGENVQAYPISHVPADVAMSFHENHWGVVAEMSQSPSIQNITPVSYEAYLKAFDVVQEEMVKGNAYLLNLTFPTRIELQGSLEDVYCLSSAPFRVLMKNNFCCFSPESFISIVKGRITTTPVKGTSLIEEDLQGQRLLNSQKELAEHSMVVDLLRNDLSRVSQNVVVRNFRDLEQIKTNQGGLWQTVSLIEGQLSTDWPAHIGDILQNLMPPGSVTGMPKHKTCGIIDKVEQISRGYYSGIFGYYRDQELHSAVSIRFIVQQGDEFWYHSGGGITVDSDPRSEYEEMVMKVYLPGEQRVI
jgi:para-aminobenzoate synthetase component 1